MKWISQIGTEIWNRHDKIKQAMWAWLFLPEIVHAQVFHKMNVWFTFHEDPIIDDRKMENKANLRDLIGVTRGRRS